MDWVKELFGSVLPFFDSVPFIRALLGFILVFFMPGFAWTLVFFRKIKMLERVLLSFALSIVVVTLSLFFANWLLKMEISGASAVVVIIIVTVIPVAVYFLRRLHGNGEGKEGGNGEESEEV